MNDYEQMPDDGPMFAFEPPKITDCSFGEAVEANAEMKEDYEAFSELVNQLLEVEARFGGFSATELTFWLSDRVNDGLVWLVHDFAEPSAGLRYGVYPLLDNSSEKSRGQAMCILLPSGFKKISEKLMPFQLGYMLQELRERFDEGSQNLTSTKEVDQKEIRIGSNGNTKVTAGLLFTASGTETPREPNFHPDTGTPWELVDSTEQARVMELRAQLLTRNPDLLQESPISGPYRVISSGHLKELLRKGLKDKLPWLQLIGDARAALGKMPESKTGLVVGAGNKTSEWQQKDWQTADIDNSYKPDHTIDANLDLIRLGKENFDFVLAERLAGMGSIPGVNFHSFVNQAKEVLKPGGILIIDTINHSQKGQTIPNLQEMGKLLKKAGFEFTAELGGIYPKENTRTGEPFQQKIIYYAQKRK